MKALCTAAAIIVTVCAVSAGAIADETTTTTTTTHERPGPSGPPGIVVGVPGVVGVEVGGSSKGWLCHAAYHHYKRQHGSHPINNRYALLVSKHSRL